MTNHNIKRVGQAITLALLGVIVFTLAYGYTYHAKLEQQNIEVRQQLEQRQSDIEQLLKDTKQKEQNEAELKKELERLNKELQAKKTRESRALAEKAVKKPSTAVRTPITNATANCEQLKTKLSRLGVSSSDMQYAIYIAQKESGCRSNAVNASSGACGEFQSLPCGKWGSPGTDTYLKNAINYAVNRYGSWSGAYNFWVNSHWW